MNSYSWLWPSGRFGGGVRTFMLFFFLLNIGLFLTIHILWIVTKTPPHKIVSLSFPLRYDQEVLFTQLELSLNQTGSKDIPKLKFFFFLIQPFTPVLKIKSKKKVEKCKEEHLASCLKLLDPMSTSEVRYGLTNSMTSALQSKAHGPWTSWPSKKLLPD